VSQILNQIMAILDLGDALIILGLATKKMFLNNLVYFMKSEISSLDNLLPLDKIYRIPVIFR